MTQPKDVKERLVDFIVDFVVIFEGYFSEYYDRLINRTGKPGKTATVLNELLDLTKPGAEVFDNATKAGVLVSVGLVQKIVQLAGTQVNRTKIKSLTQQLLQSKNNPVNVRDELVDAAIHIFSSFECQFAIVSTEKDRSGEIAMKKIAQDAINRVIHYYSEHNKETTTNTITQGLMYGNSKRYGFFSQRGHNLLLGKEKINTKDLFETLGVLDGDNFYSNVRSKFSPDQSIAFRRAFDWESVSSNDAFCRLSTPPTRPYKYTNKKSLEEIKETALGKIQEELQEGKEEKMLQEIKEIAANNVEDTCAKIETNHNTITKLINEITKQLEEISEKAKQIDQTTTEISQTTNRIEKSNLETLETSKKNQEMLKEVRDTNEEVRDMTKKTLDAVHNMETSNKMNERKQDPIRDWKRAVDSFTGREDELKDLHSKIYRNAAKDALSSQVTVVTGLGGIGKTQLARKYTERHEENYFDIVWMNAQSKESLSNSFCRLAKKALCVIETNETGEVVDINKIVQDCYNRLVRRSVDRECLLIFDNAEKSDYWEIFLPVSLALEKMKKIKILLTSRDQGWGNVFRFAKSEDNTSGILKLSTWKPEEALLFVETNLDIAHESEQVYLKELVEELQYFPLALQKAVAYINEQNILSRISVQEYINVFRKKAEDLLEFDPKFKEICDDYGKTTYTTWNITLEKILEEAHGGLAIHIMNVIAFIAPENIARDLFFDGENNEHDVREAVGHLVRYSMINGEDGKQEVLSVHRLVQRVLRLQLFYEKKILMHSKTVKLFENRDVWGGWATKEMWMKRVLMEPHLRMLRIHLRDELQDARLHGCRNTVCDTKETHGDRFERAMKEYLYRVDLLLDQLAETGYRKSGDRLVLGYGRELEAWEWQKDLDEALELARELYGSHSEEVAVLLARKGKGLWTGYGAKFILEALEIFNKRGSDRIEVGLAHVDLGYLWTFRNGWLDEGMEHLYKGRSILEKHFDQNTYKDERVTRALASLAFALWALCEYEDAKALTQKTLTTLKLYYEHDDPDRQFVKGDTVELNMWKYLVLTIGDRERRCSLLRINLDDFYQHCMINQNNDYPLYTFRYSYRNEYTKKSEFPWVIDDQDESVPTKSNRTRQNSHFNRTIFQIADLFDEEAFKGASITVGRGVQVRWNAIHSFPGLYNAKHIGSSKHKPESMLPTKPPLPD